jgi:galactokinase
MLTSSPGMFMENLKTEKVLIENLVKEFTENFGDSERTIKFKSPASLTLLGDHTHYNDGLLLTASVNRFTYIMMRKNKGEYLNVIFNGKKVPLKNLKEDTHAKSTNYTFTIIKRIFQSLLFRDLIYGGIECVIISNIPKSIGLGYYSSLQIGLFKAAKKLFKFSLTDLEIINTANAIENEFIGQISNRANYFSSTFGKADHLMFVDLRNNDYKYLPFNNDQFNFLLCDTNLTIKNSETICTTRIEECSVGVKALRLYIWGIKNLRDVDIEFLKRHINMIPQLVYKRCAYNVTEKQRVLDAKKTIIDQNYCGLGKEIYDSFKSIVVDYELNYPELNFLVEESKNLEGVIAAKSISCTTAKCIYLIAESNQIGNIAGKISKNYANKYKKELSTHIISTCKGAQLIK